MTNVGFMCNIIVPWPFSTNVCQVINMFWEFYFVKYFLKHAVFHTFQHFWKYDSYFTRALNIWSIGCTKDDKIYPSNFLLSSNLHMNLQLLIVLLAKSMFTICKPLLISQQCDVTWHNIPWHVMKYFVTSHTISTRQTNILWIFHDMPWNIFQRFLLAHLNRFTYSLAHLLASFERKG
jgi:hypothetical protein